MSSLCILLTANGNNLTTSVGNKRQSLSVKPDLRSLDSERPRSSGSVVHHEPFPVLDSLQQNRYPRGTRDQGLEHGRGNTPTPTQYASPRNSQYTPASPARSPYHRPSREWTGSPDILPPGSGRLPSEAMSRQRLQRTGGHDASNVNSHASYAQEAPTTAPKTPGGQKQSDPDTESVGSNTAPSTVWDELDDLKSRIKNLEMTGKMPSTSAGAMANQQSAERPRTATTAPTTISSSPQRLRKNSVAASELTVGGPSAANIHPLLHSALAKARPLISPSLYRAVEATAADALAFAAMTGSTGSQGTTQSAAASVISGASIADRQLRRKADSMCRNVTDLCIALCEGRSNFASPIVRHSPASMYRFQAETPPSRYARRESMDTDGGMLRSSPSRSFSRIESRRGSLLGLGLGSSNVASSPRESSEQYPTQDHSPSQAHVDYASRYSRPGSSLLRTRYTNYDDQPEDPSIRAPSRAMTEAGQRRNDYITVMQPRSPGLREALAARRNSGIPEERMDEDMTSPESIQERYRGVLERHRAPISEASLLLSNKRRRRITSLEQYSASPRLNNEPNRTTSLSRRRNVLIE